MNATPEEAWRILENAEEVCSAECVAVEVARIAAEITKLLRERYPLVLGVMRGSVIFAGQLLPQLRFPLHFDYLDVTRYGGATKGGEIQLTDAIQALLADEDVFAYEFEGVRYDCGSKLDYLKANLSFAVKHPEIGAEFRAYLKEMGCRVPD